ncbi:MAG: type II secretion system protein GspD, partial [Armatimonadota bacterium]
GWRFGTFERDKMDFVSNFVASLERKRSKILASPKVVTLNKKTGNILVGSIIPYEITVPSEGTVTRSVQLQEIGLGVEFTPIVHSDDSITMYLKPRVATFTGFSPAGFPIVSTREAKTILRIHDGDTIIIGGLLQDEELVTKAGIPFVKDWPIIGELFSSRKKTRTKTEIVILAEVTILRPGSPATAEAAAGAGGPG